jgi:hypothetical protein
MSKMKHSKNLWKFHECFEGFETLVPFDLIFDLGLIMIDEKTKKYNEKKKIYKPYKSVRRMYMLCMLYKMNILSNNS